MDVISTSRVRQLSRRVLPVPPRIKILDVISDTPAPRSEGGTQKRLHFIVYFLLFLAAVNSTACYTALGFGPPINGRPEIAAVAVNLAETGSFGNPFVTRETGPTAHVPPLYPMIRAGIFRVFGAHGLVTFLALTLLMHGLHASLLPKVSKLLFGRFGPGIFASLLSIAFPVFDLIHLETMYMAAGLLLFFLGSAWALRTGGAGFGRGAMVGVAGALLVLLNPACLLVFAPWLVIELLSDRATLARRRRTAVGILGGLCVGCAPWIARNYNQFGRFVFIRDNLGLELYISNNDCAESNLYANLVNGCHAEMHPVASRAEADMLVRMGEVDYNRNRLQVAVTWIMQHPRRFASLTAHRIVEFWFPPGYYSIWAITALSIPGLILVGSAHRWTIACLIAICAVYPLMYYVVGSSVRYRCPMLWISLLGAGYFLDQGIQRHKAHRSCAQPAAPHSRL